ncbi:MAG: DNA repair protein RecN [Flavobacteriaceae bacterium]|nr:DNA repair protein RecN [Flavobacteriaceae bacterium]
MLSTLSIKNYALIDNLKVDFKDKLSIITGETGAGKSILLGGLALVLGKRADASLVKNKASKCIIEAEFIIDKYDLKNYFDAEDIDYEATTIIRREILPNGKSRTFINDTPTTLNVLNGLTVQLIDIHSQHETLQLADNDYQFQIIDALANNEDHLSSYSRGLLSYKKLTKELEQIISNQQKSKEDYEYNNFVLNELLEANLKIDEQNELESNLEKLSHVEEIKLHLLEAIQSCEAEEIGVLNILQQVKNSLNKIANYAEIYNSLSQRVNSLLIELNDVAQELELENESLEYNPSELERIDNRLQTIYNLQKKHAVSTINELFDIQNKLQERVNDSDNASNLIHSKKVEITKVSEKLENLADKISQRRAKATPVFIKQMELILSRLEMKNTRFLIELNKKNKLLHHGKDTLEFLISANKGQSFESLKKAASGGEMSRIMLAVKLILSKYTKLPAIIFDEIDTGVSGEVSNKIAEVMQEMSSNMQVITITHLPQIAAKGNQHYKVYKEEINNSIQTNIKLLNDEQRMVELAEMLGGKILTDSALAHAKQLLA